MHDFEVGVAALAALASWHATESGDSRNEAQTRFDLIDRLLMECLGWPHEAIQVERHGPAGYTDYELGTPAPLAVVEAKREGASFELPAGWSSPTALLSTLTAVSPATAEAIQQATGYAQQRGIGIAAVASGFQLFAFLASRTDGVPPEDGRALVFASLEDIQARFVELWNALSPAGLADGTLRSRLQARASIPPPDKLSARLVEYPGFKNRNPIAVELQILGGLFLEDIVRVPELEQSFLEDAYCESGALSQYALVSRDILQARYSALLEEDVGVVAEAATDQDGLTDALRQDALAAGLSGRPLILLGDVGVGKSTFIRHLIKIDAADVLHNAVVLYVDFGSQPALTAELQSLVTAEFARQLREDHGVDISERNFVHGIYHGDLARFERGIYSDLRDEDPAEFRRRRVEYLDSLVSNREHHLRRSLEHLVRGRQKQVVVFLDNVDQRAHDFQEAVFLIAQTLAASWPVTCFVSLRPETFYRSRNAGTLQAYQPRVFTISPPRVDRVLLKRLEFGKKQLELTGHLPALGATLTLTSSTLADYISILEDAIEHNTDINAFVDNMSNENIRRALDFVEAFVGSAHVDSGKILDIFRRSGRYTLPLHEFLRAVVHGDHRYFDPTTSPITNLLDIITADPREHFLLPLILAFLDRTARTGAGRGFVRTDELFGYIQSLGFSDTQLRYARDRAVAGNLVDTNLTMQERGDETAPITRLRMTLAGAYSIHRLIPLFPYLDAIVIDTPITDRTTRGGIMDAHAIGERLDRAETFLSYLDACWQAFGDAELPFEWPARSAEALSNITEIRRRIAS